MSGLRSLIARCKSDDCPKQMQVASLAECVLVDLYQKAAPKQALCAPRSAQEDASPHTSQNDKHWTAHTPTNYVCGVYLFALTPLACSCSSALGRP